MTTSNSTAIAWPSTLAAATVLGSFALACVFPFSAVAALAALTLDRRAGSTLVAAVWAVNQAVGFFLLSFPWDGQAVGHGIAILGATLAGFEAARFTARGVGGNLFIRGGAALVVAFVVYEVLLLAYAQVGGGAENFTAEIVAQVAINDALWFMGLMVLRFALTQVTGERVLQQEV